MTTIVQEASQVTLRESVWRSSSSSASVTVEATAEERRRRRESRRKRVTESQRAIALIATIMLPPLPLGIILGWKPTM
ncbi:hypothetical protein ACLB2K_076076 [Fragaria x ananassa]